MMMKILGVSKPNARNILLSLLRFSKTKSQILQIHGQLTTTNFIKNPFTFNQFLLSLTLPNTLNIDHAERLFNQSYQPNTFDYNTMIKGYTQSSNPRKALAFYVNMIRKRILVDNYTYPLVLEACVLFMGLMEGREIHGEVVKRGFFRDAFVLNGLIGMYSKCGEMGCARLVFHESEVKDLVSWNLILGGSAQRGEMGAAQKLFDEMPVKNVISWSIMIDGYRKVCCRNLQ